MPKLSDLTPDRRFVGLFVGPSGSGKTCAEISFCNPQDPRPVKVMDFDGRIGGALGATWISKEIKSKVDYKYYPPKEEGLIENLNKELEVMMVLGKTGQQLPQTLILDSLTSACFAVLCQSIPLTHATGKGGKGKFVGGAIAMAGPEDYGVESTVIFSLMSFLRSLPITNIIVSAHVIPTYGKADPDNPYSDSIITGEKLSIRDKIGANLGIYFDHVFRFDKDMVGARERFNVCFRSQIARTSYPWLPGGQTDITGINFYEWLRNQEPKAEAIAI